MSEPDLPRVSGPSFPMAVKALATVLVVLLEVAAVMALINSPTGVRMPTLSESVFLLVVCAVIAASYWGILTSRTTCDAEFIEQTWLWRKKVRIAEITQIKLIQIPGLEALVVPRLVVRTGFVLTTFQAGDPAVLERFRLLAYGR